MTLGFKDYVMGIAVALIWGMGIVFAKAAIEQFPPILLMAFRFSVTALVLVWFVKPPWHLMRQLFWIALISAAVQYSLTFNGLRGVDASTAALVVQLEVPFLVILGVVVLGERTSLRKWIGIAVAFAGLLFMTGEPRLSDALGSCALIVGGAFTWAIGQTMIRKLGNIGGFTLIAWVAVFATPQLFAFSFALESDHLAVIREAGWVVWGTVAYLGLIMTALGYGLWYSLVGRFELNQAGPFLLLLPVFSVLGGILVLGEELTLHTVIGGLIILAGVAIIIIERKARAQPVEIRTQEES